MKLLALVVLASTAGCAVAQVLPRPPLAVAAASRSPSPAVLLPASASPSPPVAVPSPVPLPSPSPSSLEVVPPLESPPLPPALLPNNTAPNAPAANVTPTAAASLAAAVPSPSPSPLPAAEILAAIAAAPSPLPSPAASPSPALLLPAQPSPAPLELTLPRADTDATAAPDALPASPSMDATAATTKAAAASASAAKDVAAARAGNATQIAASPLFAVQSTPELSALAELGKNTSFNRALADKQLLATIFAPNNAAVDAAVAYLEGASNMTAAELKEQGIIGQLLQYHVAEGAPLLSSELENNQVLTMLDGNKTKITVEGSSARRLLAAGTNRIVYINSDSQQQAQLVGSSIQAHMSIIHTIDAVLIPQALIDDYKLSTKGMPGFVPGAAGVAPSSAPQPSVVVPTPRSSACSTAAAGLLMALPVLTAMLWA